VVLVGEDGGGGAGRRRRRSRGASATVEAMAPKEGGGRRRLRHTAEPFGAATWAARTKQPPCRVVERAPYRVRLGFG
jgi:hypothetical protein